MPELNADQVEYCEEFELLAAWRYYLRNFQIWTLIVELTRQRRAGKSSPKSQGYVEGIP
jgi:hypothetical protein